MLNDSYSRTQQIDFSKELISWVKQEGYSLLDANLFPKPFAAPLTVQRLLLITQMLLTFEVDRGISPWKTWAKIY